MIRIDLGLMLGLVIGLVLMANLGANGHDLTQEEIDEYGKLQPEFRKISEQLSLSGFRRDLKKCIGFVRHLLTTYPDEYNRKAAELFISLKDVAKDCGSKILAKASVAIGERNEHNTVVRNVLDYFSRKHSEACKSRPGDTN